MVSKFSGSQPREWWTSRICLNQESWFGLVLVWICLCTSTRLQFKVSLNVVD